jgi:pimeloyl-ACP methyl ester carboxylesterase
LNTNNTALTKRLRLLKVGTIRICTVIPSFGGFLAISRFGGTAAFSAATSRSSSCLHHFRGEKFIERKEKMTIQTNAGLSRLSNENHEQHETTREEEEHNILMQEEENTTTTNTKEEHWAPLHEDISELRIAEGVALEAKVYGDEDAPVQVVWGHGLGSSMTNEDKESLWNFWDVSERGDASSAGNGTATTTCDEDGSDGSASEEEEEVGLENLENLKDEKVRIVRYNARGHGYSSPAETSSQAKWENMAADMLKVANLKQQTRISKKTGKEKKQKLILGGASMGAAVVLHAAVQRGDVFPDGMVLVIPPTIYEQRKKREKNLKKKALEGPPPPPRLRKPRPIFDGEPEEVYVPRATVEFGMRDESYVAVSVGAAQSNLPPPEEISNVVAKVPCLLLAWDCGDKTHPVKSAEELKKLIPHCEMHVAKTLEDTEQWPRMIRDFIRSISRSSEGNVVRREGTTVTTMFHDKDYETEVTTTDWDTTDHDRY